MRREQEKPQENQNDHHIITYQNLPIEIRQRIHKDYFAYKKKFEYWKTNFENYMFQNVSKNQIIPKDILIESIQHNLQDGLAIETSQRINMKQDQHYLMGSLKELKYYNDTKLDTLNICSVYNENLCQLHFEISLPYQLNDQNFELLKKQFHNNTFLNGKLKTLIENENRNSILLRDISDPNYQTFVTIKDFVKINEVQWFALETYEQYQKKQKYFSIKNNNNQQFKFIENQDQEMIFVVGVVNQNNINKNIFEYISTEFQSNEEKKQKEQLQKDLKTTEQELSKHNNALLIKIDIFHFAVLVYPNPNNSYCLRSEDLENLTFFDSFLQQIEFYENILGQLKFVQNNWIINQFQDNQILFQKVNRYPDFFQLRIGQTILVRSKKASLNISINSVDQIYD